MNYAAARELEDKSGWHFTTMNDGVTRPAQCCCARVPATAEDVARLDWIYHGSLKVGDPILGPAHPPHATQEEAEACYRDWVVASLGLGRVAGDEGEPRLFSSWQGCEAVVGWDEPHSLGESPCPLVCNQPTRKAAWYRDVVGQEPIALCDPHYTLEVARTLVRHASQVTYS